MYRYHLIRRLGLGLLLLLVVGAAEGWRSPSVLATDPCLPIINTDPGVPIGSPKPTIGGQIIDEQTSAGISGATIKLYICSAGVGTVSATTTTDSSGNYSFGDLSQAWYYVAADMNGPLAGMQAASGTLNPTVAIEVGAGDPDVDLAFE